LNNSDRVLTLAALVAVTLLAWLYVVRTAGSDMPGMSTMDHAGMVMTMMEPWRARDTIFAGIMWATMMVAMMTPAAAPFVLTYVRFQRPPAVRTKALALLAGYLAVWTVFSLGATLLQAILHTAGLLAPEADRVAPIMGGVLFLVAGAWQFTPLKHACLRRCRSPMDFLVIEWRDGRAGALRLGFRHGLYCLGCCWALMLLLFAAGVMNLVWVAALGGWVLLEKTLPASRTPALVAGTLAIALGFWTIGVALRS
jgi:predicted metal-binding membrane protein